MAHTTPRVEQGTLLPSPGVQRPLAVGTPTWFAWLADATIFAFVGEAGSFTARRERGGRDRGYWKAYRKRDGQSCMQAIIRAHDLQLL